MRYKLQKALIRRRRIEWGGMCDYEEYLSNERQWLLATMMQRCAESDMLPIHITPLYRDRNWLTLEVELKPQPHTEVLQAVRYFFRLPPDAPLFRTEQKDGCVELVEIT